MRIFFAVCLLLLLVGCGDQAKDLYDTAQLEEKQNTSRTLRNFTGRSSKNIPARLTRIRRLVWWG